MITKEEKRIIRIALSFMEDEYKRLDFIQELIKEV